MAIYQFYLAVIPKIGVLECYDTIPSVINPSIEDGYFNSNTELFWNKAKIKPEHIVSRIDNMVDRAPWGNSEDSFNWKTYSKTTDNDAYISLDKDKHIKELTFRADLREPKLKFLKAMLQLGKTEDFLFMDRKGKLSNYEFENVKTLIKNSNAYRFLKDPEKFFDDLNSGKLQKE